MQLCQNLPTSCHSEDYRSNLYFKKQPVHSKYYRCRFSPDLHYSFYLSFRPAPSTDGCFLLSSTPHFYRILLIHPLAKLMIWQMVDSAPVLKPPYLLFGYCTHFLPPPNCFSLKLSTYLRYSSSILARFISVFTP